MAISIVTTSIKTTLTIWDVPRPIYAGRIFQVQAGLKSSRGTSMAGATIAVFDADDSLVCRRPVEDHPLENTNALYRSTLDLVAPSTVGTYSWIVKSDVSNIAESHDVSSIDLLLLVVDSPRHSLRITLTDENGRGVGGTQLRLGPYRQTTGENGSAEFLVAGGTYLLQSWNPGYELICRELNVTADTAYSLTIKSLPSADIEFL
jgi:hypothetical protein